MKEETEFKPKPLVLVGGKPILWHIMKIYSHNGFNEFILALGYKGNMIKDYFMLVLTLMLALVRLRPKNNRKNTEMTDLTHLLLPLLLLLIVLKINLKKNPLKKYWQKISAMFGEAY